MKPLTCNIVGVRTFLNKTCWKFSIIFFECIHWRRNLYSSLRTGLCVFAQLILIFLMFLLDLHWNVWSTCTWCYCYNKAFLMAQTVKNLPVIQETRVQSLSQEDPLEERMINHHSILAWRIPWTEKPVKSVLI